MADVIINGNCSSGDCGTRVHPEVVAVGVDLWYCPEHLWEWAVNRDENEGRCPNCGSTSLYWCDECHECDHSECYPYGTCTECGDSDGARCSTCADDGDFVQFVCHKCDEIIHERLCRDCAVKEAGVRVAAEPMRDAEGVLEYDDLTVVVNTTNIKE